MVASGTHVNGGCCFDYGNAETSGDDTGNGHMDAINFGTECWFAPCSGSGPWVQADLENGLFAGANGSDTNNKGNSSAYVTALLKNNGTTTYAIKGGNSQSGALTTWYNGALPNRGGYTPMHQEGAIVLGTGGDNSNSSVGSFFEGVMTSGYPTDAADNAVQAKIVAAGYEAVAAAEPRPVRTTRSAPANASTSRTRPPPGHPVADQHCAGADAIDQYWSHQLTVYSGSSALPGHLRRRTAPARRSRSGAATAAPTSSGSSTQRTSIGPQSGLCLDDRRRKTNGALVEIWTCNGSRRKVLASPAAAPSSGRRGKCVNVAGDDTGGDSTRWSSGMAIPGQRPALVPQTERLLWNARSLPGHHRRRNSRRHPGRAVGLQRRRRSRLGAAERTARC